MTLVTHSPVLDSDHASAEQMRTLVFLICRTKWRKWNVQCRSNSGADLHRYKEEEKEEEEKEGE